MASSMVMPNSERSREISRKKNKKNQMMHQSRNQPMKEMQTKNRWKTEAEQQMYSSKLIEELRHVHAGPPSPNSSHKHGQAVREAADRALAVTAKGRTRWSRAILMNRIKLKLFTKNKTQRVRRMVTRIYKPKKPRVGVVGLKGKLPTVQQKVRFLGRLVPGCRKEALPVILEETSDYIAALQMQIRAMTSLTQLLAHSGPGGGINMDTLVASQDHH